MQETRIEVSTPYQQLQTFCRFAEKHKGDYLTEVLAPIRSWSLHELFKRIRSRYLREVGEQIIRPLYYWQDGVGGDCDDASIQYMAYFRAAGISPDRIIVCEAREPKNDFYTHIFTALAHDSGEVTWLDNLPESRFNSLDYPSQLVRLSLMSEYL